MSDCKWFPWYYPEGNTWHAAQIYAGDMEVFLNIGFEDRSACARYIGRADPGELHMYAKPAPRPGKAGTVKDPVWYPAQGNGALEGLWYPRSTDGREITMGFESAGACMRYMTRAGLVPTGVHMRKKSGHDAGVIIEGVPADDTRAFLAAWDKTRDQAPMMVLPEGADVRPIETSPAGPEDGMPDDDRWEWVHVGTWDNPDPWIKGRCNHETPEPVDAYPTGELVAWLCPDCGKEFDPDRWPVPEGMWRRIPVLFEGGPSGSLHKVDGQPVLRADKEHTPWWVWTGAGILVSLYHDLSLDEVWEWIKESASWVWFSWPVWACVVWYVGIILGWWNE